MRQPYGNDGDPIETFPFEELPGDPAHESFLWGHSVVLCAGATIDAIQAGDPELTEFTGGEIGELPVHKFIEAGEKAVQPGAEARLTDRAVDRMLARSVMPIVSMKNRNSVRIYNLRSIANAPVALQFNR